MRTNIVLDEEQVRIAMELTGIRTKREVVDLAIKELVANRRKLDLRDLQGQIEFADGYDYKKQRGDRKWS